MSAIKLIADGITLYDNNQNIVGYIDRSGFIFSEDAKLTAELARRWNFHQELLEALEAISKLAGNLGDEALTSKTGANDAVDRGLKVVAARMIALAAIAKAK